MYELIQVGAQTYYIQSPTKIGVYVADAQHVYLIDSGNDKDAGKKVKKILDQNGWTLKGILNTHSHADHIGGNQYLQDQTGCKIFSDAAEAMFTQYTELEPTMLYGGYPCKDLRHKFLVAKPSEAVSLTDPDYPQGVTPIGLGGHAFRQLGYRTPDGTVFLGDCLSSESTLEKYGICYLYDVQQYLDTLDYVANMRERSGLEICCFVPSHADATADIRPLAEKNKEKVLQIADYIRNRCDQPSTFEDLLKNVFDDYHLAMSFEQYVLIGSTVRSYLSWLRDRGELQISFENNCMIWYK